ncbi:hypothetical protein BDV32DRAFT_119155 [Aspergillus pseudonomiae]|uniref:Uncharacterized protein n=1 Tax=Aspergillus pseudonomiae TaxID=1506151 RepID=A0A5N6IA63_9EURO|nr:uncharacterized protein BDV37DRAFT_929 [Aspergillus pseudonomiae]KAB8263298.1 hypothetical protein BDV32DRAFT_119155 [Aspergillus pseudonomiae]KAE8409838.1 hypothetical protein BDV37DRAFT_929 [Aspergillus pseudonomiae]
MSVLQGTVNAPVTTSAAQSLNTTIPAPATSALSSSARELLAAPFRRFSALSSHVNRLVGLSSMTTYLGASEVAGPARGAVIEATQTAADAAREGIVEAAAQADSGYHLTDIFQAVIKFSGFFSYLTSRWSLACFTVALVLNRITIYASTRRHLHLDWSRRLALRIIPILLFISQIHSLLRAIRCQTSTNYSLIRYGTPGKRLLFDHAGGGGFLYSLGSTLLPWETDEQSCSAMNMARPASSSDISYGSFVLLWPVFIRLCLSHFVETLSCALQGRPVVTEAGMSIFEHSLAFAEAESTISQTLGLGLFGLPKQSASKDDLGESAQSTLHLLSRAQVLERMNVTPELLLIALISCCNSLTSNVLDVFGKQSRYRLFNTAFWGLCFMSTMAWGLLKGSSVGSENVVLKFPTVCIVGFVPHLLILSGIITCAVIYMLALLVTAFSLPADTPQPLSLRERFALAHENMQGATQFHNIRFNRHEDFYTTLLRIGYTALTAASEAVFLNEGKGVVARSMTWLEEDRLAEIESSREKRSLRDPVSHTSDVPFGGGESVDFDLPEAPSDWESGYGREKKIEKPKNGSRSLRTQTDPGGVGAFRGMVRCYHGFAFFRGISYLLLRWTAFGLDKLLSKVGISARPQWLKTIVRPRKSRPQGQKAKEAASLDFWILTDTGELVLPADYEFDVETEMRKRELSGATLWEQSDEQRLDDKLYGWWKAGGSWGDRDLSSDYSPPENDNDDTTSVVSMSTTADSEWEDESDGRRTPTHDNPFPSGFSRESTTVQESMMDIGSFARLLDPRDQESRQEARILAAHLAAGQEGRILTRRRFQQQMEHERAQVLLSSRMSREIRPEKRKPTMEEESEILEKLILSRRSSTSVRADEQSWESGASGLGPSGPPCVICQTNPRSVITWPCRCLCVCEECRVSLAMNNFGSCVTCRQDVGGFVRLWVP